MKIIKLSDVPASEVQMEGACGAKRQLVLGAADGAPNFSLRVFRLEPGGQTPFHGHAWEHENYILKGQGLIRQGNNAEIPVQQGDFVLVLPGEKHQYINNSETEEMEFICLVPKEYE